MKHFSLSILIIILIVACNGPQKALQKGQYDLAITKAIKKLTRKPNDLESLQVVEQAFKRAVEQDKRKIEFLKKEGRPDNWDDINAIYQRLSQRQDRISKLMNIPSGIEFENYDDDIIGSKEKAAEYFYTHAETLLKSNDRTSARNAYNEFLKVKSYYPTFRDVDTKLIEARELGTSNVIFKMKNATGVPLPPQFEKELKKISLTELNKDWLRYYNKEQEGLYFDYTILVNMKVITVSPEQDKEIIYEEKKKIRDGWEYVLDENGNVKKDSLGNDIKIPKYTEIKCTVVEKNRVKSAIISGSLDYLNNRTGELIKTDPITAESKWQHRSGIANGDVRALKPATKAIIGVPPAPFPPDFQLLADAGETLKKMVKDIIYRNKNVLY